MAHNGRDKHGKKSEEAIPLTSDQDVPTSVTFDLGSPNSSSNSFQQQHHQTSTPACPPAASPTSPSPTLPKSGLRTSSSSRPVVEEAPPSHIMWSADDHEPVLSRDTSTELQDNVTRLSFLHDEVDKIFENDWRITTSHSQPYTDPNLSTLEREPSKVALTELYHVDEAEYSRHRRVSYPHIHQPLRSLSSKSLLAAKAKSKKKSKKKKKKKEKKIRSFPSRVAIKSPPIPEEEEEHQFIDDDDDDDTSSSYQSDDYDEGDDFDRPDGRGPHDMQDPLLLSSKSAPDVTTPTSPLPPPTASTQPPTIQVSLQDGAGDHGIKQQTTTTAARPGDLNTDSVGFYIGSDIPSPTDGAERLVKERGSPVLQEEKQPLIGDADGQFNRDNIPLIEIRRPSIPMDENELSPLIERETSPQARPSSSLSSHQEKIPSPLHTIYEPARKLSTVSTGGKVTFVVGDDNTYSSLQSLGDASHDPSAMEEGGGGGEGVTEADKENERRYKWKRGHRKSSIEEGEGVGEGRTGSHRLGRANSIEGSQSNRSSGKRRHHPHHQHFKQEDLILRRQKGSEVHLDETLHRSPTETEEAATLYKADLDEMASHRFEDQRGIRRHKIARSKGALQSIVHIGKVHHEKKPRATKKFDHSPHEVFVELDELHFGGDDMWEWREKARWIKFEEDVEEGAERWGKPHVASLSFHSLLELRRGLEKGSMLLDLEAQDLTSIIHNVVENLIIRDIVPEEVKGKLLRTLLLKHKHVSGGSAFLRRISSYSNLMSLDSSGKRHQNEKGLLGSLSHSSLGSSLGLHKSPSQVSQTGPGSPTTADGSGGGVGTSGSSSVGSSSKERRRSKDQGKQAAKLEMFKVDVDNNMTDKVSGGIHIGVTPIEEEKEKKHIQDIMKRIPKGSEASTVLVGQVDFLTEPAMAFVRLSEGRVLDNLTEVPLPVRFVFILLGPEKGGMDYHEVGRSLSTLMSNQHFHNVAYRAESREDLLRAINTFLDDSIVLPPGDWDHRTLLPITHMARRRAHMKQQKKQQLEKEALLAKGVKMEPPRDPLQRTGCLFGGLVNDIKQRYPFYLSDIKDAANKQCIATLFFIFFTCLSPCIAFGGLLSEKTHRLMGVSETMVSTSVFGMLFSLFSGQPLLVIGATGPVLVFEESLYKFCSSNGLEFLPVRFWIGMWVCLITMAAVALEGSFLLKYISRFTEEIFAILISLIFIYEVVKKLMEIFVHHPLMADYCGLENQTFIGNSSNATTIPTPTGSHYYHNTSDWLGHLSGSRNGSDDVHHDGRGRTAFGAHAMDDVADGSGDKMRNQPNTALLSLILTLGTFLISYFLRVFRNSKFLGRSVRRALGDFGVLIALVVMVLISFLMKKTYVQKLDITDPLTPTSPGRGWFINPMGIHSTTPVWIIFASILPAFLIFILLFMETQITEMILDKKERRLKKGSGFHLDQFLLGILTLFGGLFGLPWMCAATVRTVAHVSALSIYSRTHAPGEKPQLLGVKEQRVTNFAVHFLIGLSTAMGPVLRAIPVSALFGIFLYLGVSAMSGVQMFERIKLLLMPVKYHPSVGYVRKVPMMQMHKYTLIQLSCLVFLLVIKSTAAALAFPFLLVLLIPLRIKFVSRFFLPSELGELDKEEEDLGYEDEDDPDFYQQAHMPI